MKLGSPSGLPFLHVKLKFSDRFDFTEKIKIIKKQPISYIF